MNAHGDCAIATPTGFMGNRWTIVLGLGLHAAALWVATLELGAAAIVDSIQRYAVKLDPLDQGHVDSALVGIQRQCLILRDRHDVLSLVLLATGLLLVLGCVIRPRVFSWRIRIGAGICSGVSVAAFALLRSIEF